MIIFMRLGELRTKTRDLDNRVILKIIEYSKTEPDKIYDLDIDILNGEDELFIRLIKEEE